jgi:hypothetical protein
VIRWFSKAKSAEVWEEPLGETPGDIEVAERIRSICRSALGSAEQAANIPVSGKRAAQKKRSETERYERAAKAAMELALKVTDELMRDAAIRQIIGLCLAANNTKTARILLRAIQTPAIRDVVLRDHPEMGSEMS